MRSASMKRNHNIDNRNEINNYFHNMIFFCKQIRTDLEYLEIDKFEHFEYLFTLNISIHFTNNLNNEIIQIGTSLNTSPM